MKIQPEQSYTFSKIFELKMETDEVCKYFGYSFIKKRLNLEKYEDNLPKLGDLKEQLEEVLPLVNLTTEMSKREILIAPIITYLIRFTHAHLRIEYPLSINKQLQGILDYLIEYKHKLLIVEAKNEDLVNGFTQLSVELIALDQWEKTSDQDFLFGVLSTGNIWQIGMLDRTKKIIYQDIKLYTIPDDLELLMRILVNLVIVDF